MGCCPQSSWPKLENDANYKPKGQTLNIDGVQIYHVGSGKKGLLIIEDIFGINSGRHKLIADMLAQWGYNVFIPELLNPPYDGPIDLGPIMKNIMGQNVEECEAKFQKTIKYINQQGIQKVLSIGICWGTWFAFRMASKYDCFKAILGPHPSLRIQGAYGGSPLKLAQTVKCPAYLMPAGDDPEDIQEKGEVTTTLIKRFGEKFAGSTTFPEMRHGWTTRGDLGDEKVHRDFTRAVEITRDYLSRFDS